MNKLHCMINVKLININNIFKRQNNIHHFDNIKLLFGKGKKVSPASFPNLSSLPLYHVQL